MLQIQDNVIRMTKGDSGIFQITIRRPDQKIYRLQLGDKIVFYLNKYSGNGITNSICDGLVHSPLIVKTFEDNNIKLDAVDTKFLKEGEYYWKCELITKNGDVNSICGGLFVLSCVAGK